MRVPLVYLPCCPVPNCLGKQGELSGNSLPNLKNSSFCLPVVPFYAIISQTDLFRARWLVGCLGVGLPAKIPETMTLPISGSEERRVRTSTCVTNLTDSLDCECQIYFHLAVNS